jgi:hypothetical protein
MAVVLEFNSTAPGVTVERIRSDFEAIWKQNVVAVTLRRKNNFQAGDYFHEGDDPGTTEHTVYLNLQGQTSDKYSREKAGLSTTGATYKAYARHNEDLRNLDELLYEGKKYIIQNLNKAIHNGQVGFQEFDMLRVDVSG